jgi:ketosteroid isomerase-like protein
MRRGFVLGVAVAACARALKHRLLLAQFERNVEALNAGDYRPLLANYADDAVLHFNDGPHRWAGEHRGKEAIERFLQEFVGAGLRGEIRELWTGGPPWAMTMAVRFDDEARAGDEQLYANRVAMVIRTRWGRIVEQQDFYEDSERIPAFERALREHGIEPVAA